jgi:hypothetical protein
MMNTMMLVTTSARILSDSRVLIPKQVQQLLEARSGLMGTTRQQRLELGDHAALVQEVRDLQCTPRGSWPSYGI